MPPRRERRRERHVRERPRHGARVGDRVDVAQGGQRCHADPQLPQPAQLRRAGRVGRHRHALEHRGVGRVEPDRPVATVERWAQHGGHVAAGQPRGGGRDRSRSQLRRVHADHQRRPFSRHERVTEPLSEPRSALLDHLERGRHGAELAVEREQVPAGRRRGHGRERVRERGRRELRRLGGRARRAQPGLGAARNGRLGDHDERDVAHRSAAAMSRTARALPRTLPVTFERPPARAR